MLHFIRILCLLNNWARVFYINSSSHAIGTQRDQYWLTPPPSDVATVEYPSLSINKTGTTEQALLTNQKPEPHIRHLPSEPTMLATPLIIYCSGPCPSLVGCLPFSHSIGSQRDTGLAEARWSNMSAP
uniref:Secreted protein n=1 Tax=Mesocestoides corti TaxID=53468 RepID=A0A5K3FV40_MESCO